LLVMAIVGEGLTRSSVRETSPMKNSWKNVELLREEIAATLCGRAFPRKCNAQ